jgi:UDP-N-acetylglucosamine 1-carboxyvinyltransferase
MDKLVIEGGRPLEGSVRISGAKNAALPAMAAALLTNERIELENIPRVRDIITMGRLLAHLGATVETPAIPPTGMVIQAEQVNGAEAPYELVKTMRASILTLGPLVGRTGHARVSLPGGCAIGARPVDLHLKALEQMGAEIGMSHGYVEARAPRGGRLPGGRVFFDKITVTGTENILMAASIAKGETLIENAAREPEIGDLAELLVKMGADIQGAGTSTIRVRGKEKLHGAKHTVIPDRIEAGTFLVAGAITNGDLELTSCEPEHLTSVIAKLRETGVEIREAGLGKLHVRGARKLRAADVLTEEYPGFATDMQAQFMALVTQAEGTSVITETIFENRFLHASEMIRMGANISIEGRRAVVHGPAKLAGTTVIASDLRASASLVLAGLVAEGETLIDRVYHIDRGYEGIVEKLQGVGADIERVHGSGS